jgi:hypothetical protein
MSEVVLEMTAEQWQRFYEYVLNELGHLGLDDELRALLREWRTKNV